MMFPVTALSCGLVSLSANWMLIESHCDGEYLIAITVSGEYLVQFEKFKGLN